MITRPAEPRDADNMAEWVQTTPHNRLDPAVATYPHLYTFAVEDESGPLLYVADPPRSGRRERGSPAGHRAPAIH
jgi:hypothetical protein